MEAVKQDYSMALVEELVKNDFTQSTLARYFKLNFIKKLRQSENHFGIDLSDGMERAFTEIYTDGLNSGAAMGCAMILSAMHRAGIPLDKIAEFIPK